MSNVVLLRSTPPLFKAYEEVYSILESKYCPSFFKSEEVCIVQLPTFPYIWLLNKPYENEVTLTGQNPPLKCCQPLENFTEF